MVGGAQIGGGPQALHTAAVDHAKNPGLSVEQLSAFLRDIDYQPSWRVRSDIDADYYDSNQYDAKTLQDMEQKGIPTVVVNLIAPTINLILGMEAKVRQDWVVRADRDDATDFAEAMTRLLQQAERDTNADHACSEAYGQQIKAGLGWVHVRRNRLDPFGKPYVVEPIHRREIWWDWQDLSPTLRTARWLVRRKWYDFDVLYHMFPQHRDLIDGVASGWGLFEPRSQIEVGHPLYQDYVSERDFIWDQDTWRNLERKQAMLYEVWYRVPRWAYVLTFENGFKTEFDEKRPNPMHMAAIKTGAAKVEYVTLLDTRLSWWLGPHRLVDKETPFPHNDFPYVPFWGYREDRTAIPYGHIRAMKPLQDEVNARRARMLWQLSARRIVGFDDAVKDKRAVEAEAARPDASIWLDGKNRRVGLGIDQVLKIEDNLGLNAQQLEAYRDAAERLQDVASVFKEQLGKAGAADSGIAIAQLIEQGTTALAEVNEKYTLARQIVGEQLFSLIKQDIGTKPMEVVVTKGSIARRKITLNERKRDVMQVPTTDEFGRQQTEQREVVYRNNDVQMTRASVVLDSVPSSATFRQYQFKELANLVKQLPPELQAPMLDMVVESSDAPYKDEIVHRIRDILGIQDKNPEEMTDEERQALEERASLEDLMQQLNIALQKLTVERADLENKQIDAETEKTEAETLKTKVEAERLEREPIEPAGQSQGAKPGQRTPAKRSTA